MHFSAAASLAMRILALLTRTRAHLRAAVRSPADNRATGDERRQLTICIEDPANYKRACVAESN